MIQSQVEPRGKIMECMLFSEKLCYFDSFHGVFSPPRLVCLIGWLIDLASELKIEERG